MPPGVPGDASWPYVERLMTAHRYAQFIVLALPGNEPGDQHAELQHLCETHGNAMFIDLAAPDVEANIEVWE
jgi:hypothetical protein